MTKLLTILALLLLLAGGCAPVISTMMVMHGMFTTDPEIRNSYSWNVWGPVSAKEETSKK